MYESLKFEKILPFFTPKMVFYFCSTVFHLGSFVFTCAPLAFICVHLCSTCVHLCSLVFHLCSFVFTCVPLVFICVHLCSTCVHLCSLVFHLCSFVFTFVPLVWCFRLDLNLVLISSSFKPKSCFCQCARLLQAELFLNGKLQCKPQTLKLGTVCLHGFLSHEFLRNSEYWKLPRVPS